MDANLQQILINAGNEAKKRAKIDAMIDARNNAKEKEKTPEEPQRMSKQVIPWTDEELFDALNKANEANRNIDIKKLTNNSSNEDILKAALNVLTAPTSNQN